MRAGSTIGVGVCTGEHERHPYRMVPTLRDDQQEMLLCLEVARRSGSTYRRAHAADVTASRQHYAGPCPRRTAPSVRPLVSPPGRPVRLLSSPAAPSQPPFSVSEPKQPITVSGGDTRSRRHSACKVRNAAYRAAESSGPVSSTRLRVLALAGVSASTVGSRSGQKECIVLTKKTDLIRKNALSLDTAFSGCGCYPEKRADARGATRRGAKTHLIFGSLSEAVGKRGPGGERTSSTAALTAERFSESGSAVIEFQFYHTNPEVRCHSIFQGSPRAVERAPPGLRSLGECPARQKSE